MLPTAEPAVITCLDCEYLKRQHCTHTPGLQQKLVIWLCFCCVSSYVVSVAISSQLLIYLLQWSQLCYFNPNFPFYPSVCFHHYLCVECVVFHSGSFSLATYSELVPVSLYTQLSFPVASPGLPLICSHILVSTPKDASPVA